MKSFYRKQELNPQNEKKKIPLDRKQEIKREKCNLLTESKNLTEKIETF